MQRWHCIRYHSLRGISVRGERQTEPPRCLLLAACWLCRAVLHCVAHLTGLALASSCACYV